MMNKNREDRFVIILGCLLLFSIQFIASMVIVAIPAISAEFNMNVKYGNLINLVFLISSISLMLPFGKYISKYGIGKYLKLSLVLMCTGLFLSIISWNSNVFFISRIIQGIATAIINGATYMVVTLQLPEEKLGSALGLIGSCGYIGLCLSHTVSGIIIQYISWRGVFVTLIPLYILALIILIKLNKEWISSTDEKTDNLGSIIYFFMIAFFLTGASNITTDWGILILVLSILTLIAFIRREKNQENPVYNLKLLKNSEYVIGNFSAFAMYFITFIATYVLNLYLQYGLHFDTQTTGFILFSTPVAVVFISLIAGRLSDRYEERILSSIALTLIMINVVILCFMNYVPVYMLVVACILQGLGHGMFSSPNNRFVLTIVDEEELSEASTILSTSKDIGKTLSLSVFTVLSVMIIGNSENISTKIPELLLSSNTILLISLILGIIAIGTLLVSYIKK